MSPVSLLEKTHPLFLLKKWWLGNVSQKYLPDM